MDWHHYRYRSLWRLPAPPARVYAVLERAEDYPLWWPQVREVSLLGDDSTAARFRSLLPYDLVVTARGGRLDPESGVLEVRMAGDLVGWARWTLTPSADGGTRARYEQEVVVQRPLMRRLALIGRPAFRANHVVMMRAGRRGLTAYLERGAEGV
ncbi:SRPBCC family protein [Streptomyces sp. SCSIO 30461]|uniref:SRPBCC family protein n=1 Tax=Streptomyces sp. SCSIO 30461 TaxID=3118085 RepID=UPI0030CBD58B